MRTIAKLLTCLLLLFVAGMPVMACMQPDTTLTAEEIACCKQMANDCADMGLPSDHDCCKKTDIRTDVAVVQRTAAMVGMDSVYVVSSLPVAASDHEQVNSLLASMVHEYSPPESPPSFNQVLRI